MNLDHFQELVFHRQSTRKFLPDVVSKELLERLFLAAQRAPSGFNLQPTNFYVVTSRLQREALLQPCMGQPQVLSAPVLVVFAGDKNVAEHHFEKIIQMDVDAAVFPEERRDTYRLAVDMCFSKKPLGMGWLTKAILLPLLRLFTPLAEIPAVHKRAWLSQQISLSAMTFMLAAESAGLATCPMGWFDERRVRKIVGIPRSMYVPLVVAVGYPAERPPKRTRLPLEDVVHWV
jgi:nitroreductase